MALDAGVMSITIEYAQGLKDSDWFGKQDPYCIIRVGGQTFRTRTCVDGGKSPVWNENFRFNIINENNAEIEIKDEDVGRDDHLGSASFSLARARELGSDRINVAVIRRKSRKQRGYVSISMTWTPNKPPTRPASAQPQFTSPYQHAAASPYMPPAPYPAYYPPAAHPPGHAPPSAPPAPAASYYGQYLSGPPPAHSPYGASPYGSYPMAQPSAAYPPVSVAPTYR